jgi:hypothetical protein
VRTAAAVLAGALSLLAHACEPARPPLLVGAVEDAAKWGRAGDAMAQARESGFGAIVLSAVWERPLREPSPDEVARLRRAVDAAGRNGVRPVVAVYQFSGSTPLTDDEQERFAGFTAAVARSLPAVRDVIVGNEPNANLFWLPQFGPDGEDMAAPAYLRLLARTYDALKEVDPRLNVIGGGLAPRGIDRPNTGRDTHSPTAFIRDLGAAYRASGRDRPVMDMLSLHPYGEHSSIPPDLEHPRSSSIGLADYGKLVALLGEAFDGTAQAGSSLPIVYGEYGIESRVPAAHDAAYTGAEIESVHPVDEETQGRWYARAIALARCQPNVRMLFLFHVSDEPQLERLQTGVRYADGGPKASLPLVRTTASAPRRCG